jgi:hypothetical protein
VTHEFDRVRAAFASSLLGRMMRIMSGSIESGWHSSAFRSAVQRAPAPLTAASDRVRAVAVAVAVAAMIQPLVMLATPLTIRPTMPVFAFATIAVIALVAAIRPGTVMTAWPQSRIGRWLRR